jgi:hypothetical protein
LFAVTDSFVAPESEVVRGIFGVPLITSIPYANVAISLFNENGESYIYGYVPIVVAKCGVFLKEKGQSGSDSPSDCALTLCSDRCRGHLSPGWLGEEDQRAKDTI